MTTHMLKYFGNIFFQMIYFRHILKIYEPGKQLEFRKVNEEKKIQSLLTQIVQWLKFFSFFIYLLLFVIWGVRKKFRQELNTFVHYTETKSFFLPQLPGQLTPSLITIPSNFFRLFDTNLAHFNSDGIQFRPYRWKFLMF